MTGTEVRRTSTDGDWSEMDLPPPEELSVTQYPPEVLEALKGVRYIASQFKDGDDEVAVSAGLNQSITLLAFPPPLPLALLCSCLQRRVCVS